MHNDSFLSVCYYCNLILVIHCQLFILLLFDFSLIIIMLFSIIVVKDYSEEFRDITKSRIKESVPTGGITLLTQKPVSDDLPVRPHPICLTKTTIHYLLFIFFLRAQLFFKNIFSNFSYTRFLCTLPFTSKIFIPFSFLIVNLVNIRNYIFHFPSIFLFRLLLETCENKFIQIFR